MDFFYGKISLKNTLGGKCSIGSFVYKVSYDSYGRLFFVRFFKTQGEKNSSPEKTQGNFGAKTQGTGAFSTSFHSKLNLLELFG